MLFVNTPDTRAALRRALDLLDDHTHGAVIDLAYCGGGVHLTVVAVEPIPAVRTFAAWFPVEDRDEDRQAMLEMSAER